MSRSTSPSTGKTYGLVLVCRVWGLPRSTHYARKVATDDTPGRRGPVGFHSDEELLGHIVACIQNSPFTGEGYRKVWARLRYRLSQRFLSIMLTGIIGGGFDQNARWLSACLIEN